MTVSAKIRYRRSDVLSPTEDIYVRTLMNNPAAMKIVILHSYLVFEDIGENVSCSKRLSIKARVSGPTLLDAILT